jgi:hypothetical protein
MLRKLQTCQLSERDKQSPLKTVCGQITKNMERHGLLHENQLWFQVKKIKNDSLDSHAK